MLSLKEIDGTLLHVNLRTEKHGKEFEPASDLKISVELSNDVLDTLEPGLRAALYEAERTADLVTPGHMPKLRWRSLEQPVALASQLIGAKLTVHRGISGTSDIELVGAANKMQAACKEGGTVLLSLRFQCAPTPEQLAALYTMQRMSIVVSLDPPTADQMAEAIRAREKAKNKAEPADQQTLPILPANPPGGKKVKTGRRHAEPSEPKAVAAPEAWPFPTKDPEANGVDRSGALKALAAAGYRVPSDEVQRWSENDLAAAVDYCSQLENIRGKTQPPSPPTILKGRVRSRPRAGVH